MKGISTRRVKWWFSGVLAGVLVGLWSTDSDLAYLVAQQRDVLLGHYSLEKFVALLVLTPVIMLVIVGLWKRPKPRSDAQKRQEAFKTIALVVSIVLTVFLVDVALRVVRSSHYVRSGASYHRLPNRVLTGTFDDAPGCAFTYPSSWCGYGSVDYTLTVDDKGFRNVDPPVRFDWLMIGDSFTEGSSVSDDQAWPVVLAHKAGRSFYNLGMSGGNPVSYLDTLQRFGLAGDPKRLLCMLYEGNDFRGSNFDSDSLEDFREKNTWFQRLAGQSPLREMFKRSLIGGLGPMGADRFVGDVTLDSPEHPLYAVSWLPFEYPAGAEIYYAFKVKRVRQHLTAASDFCTSRGFRQSTGYLLAMRDLCREHGIDLVILYAPDKPHVLMDAVTKRVDARRLSAFMALAMDGDACPGPEVIRGALRDSVTVMEKQTEAFCREKSIDFISLTGPLQAAMADGVQCYYTFDQHWSPEGHRVVADAVFAAIAAAEEPDDASTTGP